MPPRPPLSPLDTAPLKDLARGLRFAAERGSRTLRNALPLDALPDPAQRVAEQALSQLLQAGADAERSMSALAHALLDADDIPPSLTVAPNVQAEAAFAHAAQAGLRAALAHLGADSALVSETSARRAWQGVASRGPGRDDTDTAAALFAALLQAPVLREVIWPDSAAMAPAEAARIATFAVLLAMLADPAGYRDLIPAACDIALALRGDLACDDPTRLAALFDEFRAHV